MSAWIVAIDAVVMTEVEAEDEAAARAWGEERANRHYEKGVPVSLEEGCTAMLHTTEDAVRVYAKED